MKYTIKVLAAVLTLAAGASSFAITADALNTHLTMRQCKMNHSEHYCLLSVHQPNSNADHSMPASKPAN
jgi:hypothetical protein